jgi:hypothetical protein
MKDDRSASELSTPYFEPDLPRALLSRPSLKTASAPAAAFFSNSDARSGRTEYVRELMRHIPIDSYGRCLNNRQLEEDRGSATWREVIRDYRFTLAFENSLTDDYVTQKFFTPLTVGSVPVYLGAPNIGELAPADGCYIDVRDFPEPRDLAGVLLQLSADELAYGDLHRWRTRPRAQISSIAAKCSRCRPSGD